MRKALEAIGKHCSGTTCRKCDICTLLDEAPANWDIDRILKVLGIQEKEPRKLKTTVPTIELAIQVIADMEKGTPFCTAYRRLNLPEAKLRLVINSDDELLIRYKKALQIAKESRLKKYKKG